MARFLSLKTSYCDRLNRTNTILHSVIGFALMSHNMSYLESRAWSNAEQRRYLSKCKIERKYNTLCTILGVIHYLKLKHGVVATHISIKSSTMRLQIQNRHSVEMDEPNEIPSKKISSG